MRRLHCGATQGCIGKGSSVHAHKHTHTLLQIRACPQDPAEEKERKPRKRLPTKQNLPSAAHHVCHSVTILFFPSFGYFHFSFEIGEEMRDLFYKMLLYYIKKLICTLKILVLLLGLLELCGAKQTRVSQDFKDSNIIPLVFN